MQILYNIFNTILDAGAVVMLPIIITIVGLIFQPRNYQRLSEDDILPSALALRVLIWSST